jgi:hypothetical protein
VTVLNRGDLVKKNLRSEVWFGVIVKLCLTTSLQGHSGALKLYTVLGPEGRLENQWLGLHHLVSTHPPTPGGS